MKHKYFTGSKALSLYSIIICIMAFLVLLASCDEGPTHSPQKPGLPKLPESWNDVLGEPSWRLEWVGEDGRWQEWIGPPGSEPPNLTLIEEWASAVLAWPFWPEWDLTPGVMKPAGALFPWDSTGDKLNLSWKGGVEAVFWKEMAAACGSADSTRLPWYFDWPRFREILGSDDIPGDVSEDLWLVDWRELGIRTVQSGFDRRRITQKKYTEITIPGLEGRWISSSPFAHPLDASPETPLCLKVTDSVNTWVSSTAILKCSTTGWVLREKL